MTKLKKKPQKKSTLSVRQRLKRFAIISAVGLIMAVIVTVLAFRFLPIWATPYMLSEKSKIGEIQYEWTSLDDMSPDILLSIVAAEDVNFCRHWGFDMSAIRDAIAEGGQRGASTISQQVVKNTFLWHGRSWPRKALEAVLTPIVELLWSKRRILEVYANVAEFDQGVFGVEAAAQNYFGIGANAVSLDEAALLAAVLPDPKGRSASRPTPTIRKRAMNIMDGAVLIQQDDRSSCFRN